MRGQLVERHSRGEGDVLDNTGIGGQSLQCFEVRPPADDRRARPRRHGRGSPGAPGSTCPAPCAAPAVTRRRPWGGHPVRSGHAVPRAPTGPAGTCRCRRRAAGARRPSCGPNADGEAGPGVAADVGDDVGAVTDPAQRGPRHRQHRPPHLVTVGAGQHPCHPGPPSAGPQQSQRCGRAEPHGFDVRAPRSVGASVCRRRVPAASACRGGGRSRDPLHSGPLRHRRPRPSIAARTPSPGGRRLPPAGRPDSPDRTGCRLGAVESRWLPAALCRREPLSTHPVLAFCVPKLLLGAGSTACPLPPLRQHGIGSDAEHLAQRRGYADVARGARAQIQPAQRLRAVTVGDEPGEQPRAVVCRRQLRGTAGEVVVGGQRGQRRARPAQRERAGPRSRRRPRSATAGRQPRCRRGRRSEKAHAPTQFARPHRSWRRRRAPAPPADR